MSSKGNPSATYLENGSMNIPIRSKHCRYLSRNESTMGIDSITRGFPFYDMDINRIFPGMLLSFYQANLPINRRECQGSDYAIDIHASNIFL